MSAAAISAILNDRTLKGDLRLAMLAVADAGGKPSIASVCRWVNCDEDYAFGLLEDMADSGVVERFHGDDDHTMRYFSEWRGRNT